MTTRERQRQVQLYRGQVPSPGRPAVAWRGRGQRRAALPVFRLLTFWLPVLFGWATLRYLDRKQAL